METVRSMKLASETLKVQQNEMKIADIDNIMDDIQDQIDAQNEINDALCRPIGHESIDPDDLDRELEELEEMIKSENSSKIEEFPKVPNGIDKETDDLNELKAFEMLVNS